MNRIEFNERMGMAIPSVIIARKGKKSSKPPVFHKISKNSYNFRPKFFPLVYCKILFLMIYYKGITQIRQKSNQTQGFKRKEFPMKTKKKLIGLVTLVAIVAVLASVFAMNVSAAGTVYTSGNSLYTYTLDDNNRATIVSYLGEESAVTVGKVDGRNVVAIGKNAFAGNT